jgi:hypothetical protein
MIAGVSDLISIVADKTTSGGSGFFSPGKPASASSARAGRLFRSIHSIEGGGVLTSAILDDGLTVLAYPVSIHGQRVAGCTTANFDLGATGKLDDLRCNAVPAHGSALDDV